MSQRYDSDNIPAEIETDALPADLFEAARAAINDAADSDLAIAMEAKGAFVYNRRGYNAFIPFDAERGAHDLISNDDVILQLTVRIPNPNLAYATDSLKATTSLVEAAVNASKTAEQLRLEKEIADAEAAAKEAEATAQDKRNKLNALLAK